MDMHPELLFAARVALGLTRAELAEHAGVGERTLADLEGGRRSSVETYILVRSFLESKGVTFQPARQGQGPGLAMPEGWAGSPLVTPRKTRRGPRKAKITGDQAGYLVHFRRAADLGFGNIVAIPAAQVSEIAR